MAKQDPAEKICATCGRPFSWRKAWEKDWDQVRYCSAGCRRNKPGERDRLLEQTILDMVGARTGTACPSEIARKVGGDDWRELMEPTRRAARRLAAGGRIVITQQGKPVGNDFKGPIRLGSA